MPRPIRCQAKDDVPSVGTLVGGATQNSGKSAGMPGAPKPIERTFLGFAFGREAQHEPGASDDISH